MVSIPSRSDKTVTKNGDFEKWIDKTVSVFGVVHCLPFVEFFIDSWAHNPQIMHIAILTWWISTERTVALRSGENMKGWCTRAWHTSETFDFPSDIHRFLQRHQASVLAKYFPTKNLKKHLDIHQDFDLVIPIFHGIYGEDGQVTAFLSTLGYHYAYSDFDIHALCIDKYRTNQFIRDIGIHIPETIFLRRDADFELQDVPFPAIVKPNRGGSSLWTSKVMEHDELAEACIGITDDDILIQECIEWREFTVGVYRDTDWYKTLPIIEIRTLTQDFFDYSEKYETDGSNEVFMIGEDELQKRLQVESLRVCEYIGTKWVVRLDWRYDGKDIYFLEVNTIPGFTSGSLVPKMWKKADKNEKEFVEMLAWV